MAKRRRFTATFKARVALEAFRGDKTVQELAAKHQVHPNQVSVWKRKASDSLVGVFAGEGGGTQPGVGEASQAAARQDRGAGGGEGFLGERVRALSRDVAAGPGSPRPSEGEPEPAMPAAGDQPLLAVLPVPGKRRDPGVDASDRCAVSGASLLRQPTDEPSLKARRDGGRTAADLHPIPKGLDQPASGFQVSQDAAYLRGRNPAALPAEEHDQLVFVRSPARVFGPQPQDLLNLPCCPGRSARGRRR